MMAQKNLLQLLEEDQEPFHLNTYIAEKRVNLKRVSPKTELQLKKRKPISSNSIFHGNLCRNACFTSFQPSPEITGKSPLFQFRSPARNRNAIFLHIPARTSALLLEAALKIQKQKSSSKTVKSQIKNPGFARFGSVLKKLSLRKNSIRVPEAQGETSSYNGRSSYGFLSEINQGRTSIDLGTSCSSTQYEDDYCESPFRFVLQPSPSYGCRTPEFSSPAASPCKQDETVNSAESLKTFQMEEDEEDKEQCSPVSVLDGPFDDSYDEERDEQDRDGNGNGNGDEDYDVECSYATIQRTKQQLLNKLRRFERLADLDPIELDKIMQEEELDEKDDVDKHEYYNESLQWGTNEIDMEWFVREVANDANLCKSQHFLPRDMRKLVTDLIAEEEGDRRDLNTREKIIERVCKRLELWKEVELNTIDMMVEKDLRNEIGEWKKNQKQRGEEAADLELAIFSLLVEELAEEFAC